MRYDVGDTATLRAEFVLDDVPTDPTAVTLLVRAPGGEPVERTPVRESQGVWAYQLELDDEGLWRWEFTGTGNAGGVQAGWLRAYPSLLTAAYPLAVVSVDDVQQAVSRELTADEADRAEALVAQVLSTLEGYLGRWLWRRRVVDELHTAGLDGTLTVNGWPLVEVESVTTLAGPVPTPVVSSLTPDTLRYGWTPGARVEVTYVAGDDPPDPAVVGVVTDAVARSILAGPVVSSGTVQAYTVEGESVTYGPVVNAAGSVGRVTVAELGSLSHLMMWSVG